MMGNEPVCGSDIGPAICKALGLDAGKVSGIQIEIPGPCDPVVVRVARFIDDDESSEFVATVERYNLVLATDDAPPAGESSPVEPGQLSQIEAAQAAAIAEIVGDYPTMGWLRYICMKLGFV